MLNETVRRAFLVCVLATRVIVPSSAYASSGYSYSLSYSIEYPDCGGDISSIADGLCQFENNNEECEYDGGDCCECSCSSSAPGVCGFHGFVCKDPTVGEPIRNCTMGSDERPEVSPCAGGTPSKWVVETTAHANVLAESILCSGGIFEVEWKGHVSVMNTLYAIDGTVLDITGASNAVADGGGTTQLFSTFNGSLRVSDMEVRNGAGLQGGAIYAAEESEVVLTGVSFSSNIANISGGAVHLEGTSMALIGSSTFTSNRAIRGGAISFGNSELVQHGGSGDQSQFVDNIATYGGALYLYDSSIMVTIPGAVASSTGGDVLGSDLFSDDSYDLADCRSTVDTAFAKTTFTDNTAEDSGGAVYMNDESQLCCVGETTFEGNTAKSGGAVFFEGSSIITSKGRTIFTQNRARLNGGAIAYDIEDAYSRTGLFFNGSTSFANNSCGGSGGAMALLGDLDIEWRGSAPEFWGNSAGGSGGAIFMSDATNDRRVDHARFTENQAQNGGAVFVLGCNTTFYNCTFVENTATNAGGAIETTIGQDQIVDSLFSGNVADQGGALRLRGTADVSSCSFFDNKSGEGGGSAISNAGIISAMSSLKFSANRFQCPSTHFLNFSEGIGRFEAICEGCIVPCQDCIVEDNTSVPICTATFAHANSGGGATVIEEVVVDTGYWRASNKSSTVLSCYNTDACLGGVTGDPDYCLEGYEGPYCSVCSEGYGTTLAFRCRRCSKENLVAVIVIAVIAVLAALLVVWHLVSIQEGIATGAPVVRLETILPLQTLKIIVVVWQIVTQFSSVANVVYPEMYQRFLEIAAWANFDLGRMISAGCIMDIDFHDGLLVATIAPLAIMTVLGMTYAVAVRRNLGSEGALRAVRRNHQNALVVVTFFVYSSVSSAVFRTFACDALDDGNVYLRTDYRIVCDSPRHQAFQIYAGLMILIYPVGIPLFYTVILFHEHKALAKGRRHGARLRYKSTSTLRKPYRPSVFYYEVVECSRRVLLTGAVVFIYPNTAAQIAVTILIAFSFVLVSEGLRPYASRWDSWVSRAGHVIVFLSMYIALLLRVDVSDERQLEQKTFAGILVAAHVIMIFAVIVETMALLYSLRNKETSLPISRGSSYRSCHASNDS